MKVTVHSESSPISLPEPGHVDRTADPLVAIPGTDWQVWRSVILRGAGFPIDGLDRLAAPQCARAADDHLAGRLPADDFDPIFARTTRAIARELHAIAADPLFREAVTWQSTSSVTALDGLVRSGPDPSRISRHRDREILVTRYWQRYCGKNDTIGFFGPVSWLRLTDDGPGVRGRPGPGVDRAGLIRSRRVSFEWRALTAYADRLAADERFRPWLPVRLQPHLALDGTRVLRVGAPPVALPPAQAALVAACGKGNAAVEVVAEALADPTSGLRRDRDAYLVLDQLARDGLLRWRLDLPLHPDAEEHLRRFLAGIGDPALQDEARRGFNRLCAARDAVAAAAGDPDRLRVALADLDAEFVAVTGAPTRHRPGETYVGRTIVYEDTVRDLDLELGPSVLAGLSGPLAVLLQAARWLTVALADSYLAALRELYDEAVTDLGTRDVPMGELWYLANGVMFGAEPTQAVMAEFTRRWSELLRLADAPPDAARVHRGVADLLAGVGAAFPADAPGWPAGRVHSPDLHLCADSPEALARGDFTAVLGELHAAWLTADTAVFLQFHPDVDALRAAAGRDLGVRTALLYPPDFPQLTARIAEGLLGPDDVRVAYAPAPAATPTRIVPLAALTVSDVDGVLTATDRDGARRPLVELFGPFLSALAVNAFKLVSAAPHTPRVTVDRLVLQRETWRTTVGDTGLAGVRGETTRYLAARRWRAALGLPERIFVRVGTEIKPCYVDFTSPAYVAALCAMIRVAQRSGGPETELVVSEMLPDASQAWLTDAAGRRYSSELRMVIRDPVPAHSDRSRPHRSEGPTTTAEEEKTR